MPTTDEFDSFIPDDIFLAEVDVSKETGRRRDRDPAFKAKYLWPDLLYQCNRRYRSRKQAETYKARCVQLAAQFDNSGSFKTGEANTGSFKKRV